MITADAQQLEPGGRVTLYELDASSFGADQLFFHQHLQTGVIWWQGQEYGPWPIEATGFARTSDQPPNPRLKVSNIDGRITALCLMFDDLVGARVIRRQTLVKYLDAVNFPAITNRVRNSADAMAATWSSLGTSATPVAPISVDGITFKAPSLVASTVSGGYPRRVAGMWNTPAVTVNKQVTTTVYFRFGTSGAFRLHYTNPTVAGVRDCFIWGRATDTWPTVNLPFTAGQAQILEYKDLGNGLRKLVVVVTYSEAGNGAPSYGFGPHPSAIGQNVTLLGMQVEDGPVASPFTMTSADPSADRNPTADPNEHFLDEIWFIERKVGEEREAVEFELTTAIDLNGEQLPGRQVIAGVCGWLIRGGYRGPYCGYNGPAVADANDVPTTDPSRDQCGGRVGSCKLRFGADKPLPYGGFPAAGLLRT
ncbi:phage minor tail protein L [Stenotrophomonas lactitubi]|uniref:phage minor tail protein L n=1 Tax=Stenotrophomonas lactitubi TaxID=2045214 RepID=UPI001FAF6DF1|nr:phage minor tail protein L [Stenotrophomonas lactitubi]